jgi:hypothetical protein
VLISYKNRLAQLFGPGRLYGHTRSIEGLRGLTVIETRFSLTSIAPRTAPIELVT